MCLELSNSLIKFYFFNQGQNLTITDQVNSEHWECSQAIRISRISCLLPSGDVSNGKNSNPGVQGFLVIKFTAVQLSRGGCEAASSLHLQNQIFVFVQYLDEDLKVAGKYKGNDYSQYSPWSCDTIGSYIGTKDAKPKDVVAVRSVEMAVCRG